MNGCRCKRIGVTLIAMGWALSAAAVAPTTVPTSHVADHTIDPAIDPSVKKTQRWLSDPSHEIGGLISQPWAFDPLDKQAAKQSRQILSRAYAEEIRRTDGKSFKNGEVIVGGKTLKFLSKHFGIKPESGWPMFISMHGGGNAPASLNDQQWQNQSKLYEPENSFYVAPRAPTNTWNLWHEPHLDPLFDRLIADAIAMEDVDPNRIYLLGYSAGGDGVYQLAPRMADRFAAASMMAGHPNESQPDGLRNLPFAIHVGALDDGYGRNKIAEVWRGKLDTLQAADPGAYIHDVQLHEGRQHWMNREDKSAIPWMAAHTRNPLPDKIVWQQGDVPHHRFYWLALPPGTAKKGQRIIARRSGQIITIEKAENARAITVLLSDDMLDLDQPVVVRFEQKTMFKGIVRRSIAAQLQTLAERGDPMSVFDGSVTVELSADRVRAENVDQKDLDRAVAYLRLHMPQGDRGTLDEAFLNEHASVALAARAESPWSKVVPDELFLEFVLPYANIDETRELWRRQLGPIARQIVSGINAPGEAAKKLNVELFEKLHVRYHATRRPFPNQSPAETIACGYASCTGLSILLIDACRVVNIPARLVGIASWVAPSGPTYQSSGNQGGGNHTWVEIWDGRQWRFLGASEPSDFDKTWFVDAAARSNPDAPIHSIFATAFAPSGDHFVLPWARNDESVPAVNVSRYYTSRTVVYVDAPRACKLEIRQAGRLVAAGDPGEFILGKGQRYVVQTLDREGRLTQTKYELTP